MFSFFLNLSLIYTNTEVRLGFNSFLLPINPVSVNCAICSLLTLLFRRVLLFLELDLLRQLCRNNSFLQIQIQIQLQIQFKDKYNESWSYFTNFVGITPFYKYKYNCKDKIVILQRQIQRDSDLGLIRPTLPSLPE